MTFNTLRGLSRNLQENMYALLLLQDYLQLLVKLANPLLAFQTVNITVQNQAFCMFKTSNQ